MHINNINNINAIYAQSGGVTAVINSTACGVIETIHSINNINQNFHVNSNHSNINHKIIGKVYAGINGIIGILQEDLIDLSKEPSANIRGLKNTPAGAFGSCRYKLKDLATNNKEYSRIIEVFKAHNIGYFFYNGGGDSQDTTYKISQISEKLGYPIKCIGIPKTIDNDLAFTDNCPGFGSVAKYVAISTLEASLDLASMAKNSTKVFILEVMGRNAGWIAASAALATNDPNGPPHIILFPEIPFNKLKFLELVQQSVSKFGYCVIVTSEGITDHNQQPIASVNNANKDQFGHTQLGGIAGNLAAIITQELQFKTHWAVADYLQRSARHIASKVDVDQAYALGKAAVEMAIAGKNAFMPIIVRTNNDPYTWKIETANLSEVANIEKKLPSNFIDHTGFNITKKCREYLLPLIQGEDYPEYHQGIPKYTYLEKHFINKKLPEFIIK